MSDANESQVSVDLRRDVFSLREEQHALLQSSSENNAMLRTLLQMVAERTVSI